MCKSNISKVIAIIKKIRLTKVQILAIEAARILFPRNTTALFVTGEKILLISIDALTAEQTIKDLCALFSRLHYMEENYMIYVLPQEQISMCVVQEGANDFAENGAVGEYDLGNGNRLCKTDAVLRIDTSSNETLSYVTDLSNLADSINHYLFARIIPTSLMPASRFRFDLSINDLLTRVSIIIAFLSTIVAIVATIVSPFLSVNYANEHGYSTIKQSQFDSIVAWPSNFDSIVMIKQNTIIKVKHDTIFIKESPVKSLIKNK